jgi:hypothetical protein
VCAYIYTSKVMRIVLRVEPKKEREIEGIIEPRRFVFM